MTFKVIIAGGRDFIPTENHLFLVEYYLQKYYNFKTNTPVTEGLELVTGTAKGADQIPYMYRDHQGVPIREFPPDWDKFGKSAGYIRNSEMSDYADALIAFWDGVSRGTGHMIDLAKKRGLKVRVIKY